MAKDYLTVAIGVTTKEGQARRKAALRAWYAAESQQFIDGLESICLVLDQMKLAARAADKGGS